MITKLDLTDKIESIVLNSDIATVSDILCMSIEVTDDDIIIVDIAIEPTSREAWEIEQMVYEILDSDDISKYITEWIDLDIDYKDSKHVRIRAEGKAEDRYLLR